MGRNKYDVGYFYKESVSPSQDMDIPSFMLMRIVPFQPQPEKHNGWETSSVPHGSDTWSVDTYRSI